MPAASSLVVPAMLLPGVVLFPHSLLPLHIFEPRYRQMLDDALAADSRFAIAGCPAEGQSDSWEGSIATIGIVRDRRANPDGTSDIVLQGSLRGRIRRVELSPYPVLHLTPLESRPGGSHAELAEARDEVLRAARRLSLGGGGIPRAILAFLNSLAAPDAFADTASHLLFDDLPHRLRLLAAPDTLDQLRQLTGSLEARAARRTLEKLLPGASDGDDSMGLN